MEIQKWSSYCGLGIIGSCFRRQYQRPLHDENNHQEQPPVIFDTAHMGKIAQCSFIILSNEISQISFSF